MSCMALHHDAINPMAREMRHADRLSTFRDFISFRGNACGRRRPLFIASMSVTDNKNHRYHKAAIYELGPARRIGLREHRLRFGGDKDGAVVSNVRRH